MIPASNFIVKPSAFHTNFKISAEGEALQLTRPDGTVADQLPAVALPADISFGRPESAPGTWLFFDRPTRGGPNIHAGFSEILGDSPTFSQGGGFHESGFMLSLAGGGPGTSVIYTLDGSIPDPANIAGKTFQYTNSYPGGSFINGNLTTLAYAGPVEIRDRSGDPNGISQRTTTYGNSSGYAPTSPVFKGTVVRARLVRDGALPGPVVTHSYFVSPEGPERYDLPVISLSINEDELFGYTRGLYTAGEDYDHWREYSGWTGNGGTPANYKRRGAQAEHPAHFELFDPQEGRVLSQNLRFRMHGGWSRAWPQKSLRIYADRDEDSDDAVNHSLIPGLTGRGTGQPVQSFRRFVLRNSGNDDANTRFRDAFIQALSEPLGLDQQGYQPTIHFINGEYWGLISIRERIDRHFIASHHGVDPDRVAILSNNAEISEGSRPDRDDFIALRDYISSNSMSNPAHFTYVAERMDLDNFIRYNVAQIYANNRDWPHNNIDFWRVAVAGGADRDRGHQRWPLALDPVRHRLRFRSQRRC